MDKVRLYAAIAGGLAFIFGIYATALLVGW